MPEIGRPQVGNNPFKDIQMAPKVNRAVVADGSNSIDQSVGDKLNDIIGRRQDFKYADKDKHNQMDKNGFLKLLSHQLANQDPLKPMDQKEFAADLAQFSQLEQMTNMNTKLGDLTKGAPDEMRHYGASFLGKEIMTLGTSVRYPGDGSEITLPFQLPKGAKKVIVRVFDQQNQLVSQIETNPLSQGSHEVPWNGVGTDKRLVPKGEYRFEVHAWDEGYQFFKGKTQAHGLVTGVQFENGETVLIVDGNKKVFLRDVQSFKLPQPSPEKAQTQKLTKNVAQSAYQNQNPE